MEATVAENLFTRHCSKTAPTSHWSAFDMVSATTIRTVEVTICIISERLLDRPGQLPYAWKPRLSNHDIHAELICAVSLLTPRTLTN